MGEETEPPADSADNTDQPDLFTQADQPIPWAGFDVKPTLTNLPNRPTCNLCGRPAFWRPNKRQWSAYCGSTCCISRVRLCKHCGNPFNVTAANARYCSDQHRTDHYRTVSSGLGPVVICPVDGTEHRGRNRWHLCGDCYALVLSVSPALYKHHVPTALVVELIKNPTCQNPGCDADLLTTVGIPGGRKRMALVVDHDHDHCPGAHGCADCVRGLLCWGCNVMAGMADDSTRRLRGMADYLDHWRNRT